MGISSFVAQDNTRNNTRKEDDEEFILEDTLLNAINFHNNIKHSITGFKTVDLKEVENINLINQVNENIKKNISRVIKYKDLYLLEVGDLLLLNDNIKIKNSKNKKEIIK